MCIRDRDQIAALFARAHVFLDMSHWQAFGRAGLEAMASGCVAVVPADSGSEDYAVDGVNARLVSTKDEAGAVAVLAELARDAALRARLRARALETVEGYALRAASATTLRVLCDALDDHAELREYTGPVRLGDAEAVVAFCGREPRMLLAHRRRARQWTRLPRSRSDG